MSLASVTLASTMRLAFERATSNTPVRERTRLYAMVRSALNRKLGLPHPRQSQSWSVSRRGR